MAGRLAVRNLQPTRNLSQPVVVFDLMLHRALCLCRRRSSSCGLCVCTASVETRTFFAASTNRKCPTAPRTAVAQQPTTCLQIGQTNSVDRAHSLIRIRHDAEHIHNSFFQKSSTFETRRSTSTSSICRKPLLPQMLTSQRVAPLHHYHSVRHFSGRQRDQDDDEEERKRQMRGAVMYLPNPVTWFSTKWNTARLRRLLDPSFSENEFLFGARQAISHVTQMVSRGKFEQLSGLVVDEVRDWLVSYRASLSQAECQALALDVDDVVLMKIRYVQLDSQEDKELAFVDSVCFGLKLIDKVPYLVDMGIRFQQDYSTDPPSGWVVAGVSHIRLQDLAPE